MSAAASVVGTELLVEVRDRVLYATLNRPDKHNALRLALLDAIRLTFVEQATSDNLVAAVLTGAGTRSFAAGGDLRELDGVRGRAAAEQMERDARAALDAVRAFPVPVVAALNGNALGGGAELAVACDFRVVARGATLAFVQGRIGVSTGWGGGIDLHQIVGRARALRLLATCEAVDAARGLEIGLFDHVAAEGQDIAAAVEDFLAPLRRQHPQVMRGFKALADAYRSGADRAAMAAVERRHFVDTWLDEDHWRSVAKVLPAKRPA
ncbi:MAG: enoyl-CoA hydratase/isomerase family protein [Alphaproteobacteria bacterium]